MIVPSTTGFIYSVTKILFSEVYNSIGFDCINYKIKNLLLSIAAFLSFLSQGIFTKSNYMNFMTLKKCNLFL